MNIRALREEGRVVAGYLREARRWRCLGSITRYRDWRSSLRGTTALDDAAPWIVYAARRHIEHFLRDGMRVFEYGSGGSTLFYAGRGARVVAVEHDRDWHRRVGERLAASGPDAVDLRLREPEHVPGGRTLDAADPASYASEDPAYVGATFHAYASAIDEFPDEYFDLVSVDGRARPSCLRHAAPKVRRGGLLVLDNSERVEYACADRLLTDKGWPRRICGGPGPYNSYFWQTTIWRRP